MAISLGALLALILLIVETFKHLGWTGGPDPEFAIIWLSLAVVLLGFVVGEVPAFWRRK